MSKDRLARLAFAIASVATVTGGFELRRVAQEHRAAQRRDEQTLECAERDRASARLAWPEFWRDHLGAGRDHFERQRQDVHSWHLAARECKLGHRLFDALAARSAHESFVFSPHGIYASLALAAASGNDAMIRQVLAASGQWDDVQGAIEDEYLLLKSDYGLYQADALSTDLERRFPIQYDLTFTLRARDASQIAPNFLNMMRAAGPPVAIAAPGVADANEDAPLTDLRLSSDFHIAGAWFEDVLEERDGQFHDATGGAVNARFSRIQTEQPITPSGYTQRVDLVSGGLSQVLKVVLVALVDGQDTTDFCYFGDRPGEWANTIVEIPETTIRSVVSSALCSSALVGSDQPRGAARYSCAYSPNVGTDTSERVPSLSLEARASLSFTRAGVSWRSAGPSKQDFPPVREVPVQRPDIDKPPRTLSYDGPFLFAVFDALGLVQAVGRVSTIAGSDGAR